MNGAATRDPGRLFDQHLEHGRRGGDVVAVRIEPQDPNRQRVVPVIAIGREKI